MNSIARRLEWLMALVKRPAPVAPKPLMALPAPPRMLMLPAPAPAPDVSNPPPRPPRGPGVGATKIGDYRVVEVEVEQASCKIVGKFRDALSAQISANEAFDRGDIFRLIYNYGRFTGGIAGRRAPNETWQLARAIAEAHDR